MAELFDGTPGLETMDFGTGVSVPTLLAQAKPANLADLEKKLEHPNVQAFLTMVSEAEGATYNSLYGDRLAGTRRTFEDYSQFPSYDRPNSPSGRYQIIAKTYDGLKEKLGLADFSPRTQDLMAVQLLEESGAMKPLLTGDFDTALLKASPQWAALPRGPGKGSFWPNQPNKPYEWIRSKFELNRAP